MGARGYKYHDMRTVMGRINAEKEIDRLTHELIAAKSVIRDLLESYLATFDGNKDDLAYRAEKILHANDPRSRAG